MYLDISESSGYFERDPQSPDKGKKKIILIYLEILKLICKQDILNQMIMSDEKDKKQQNMIWLFH